MGKQIDKLVDELLNNGLYKMSIDDVREARAVARRLLRERDNVIRTVEGQQEYIDQLERERDKWEQDYKELQHRFVDCKAENSERRAVIEQVEWVNHGFAYGICPWCRATQWYRGNHAPDCPRQIALGLAKE